MENGGARGWHVGCCLPVGVRDMETIDTTICPAGATVAAQAPGALMPAGGVPRWLVVVCRDRPEVHARLRRSFDRSPLVEVLLDRRQAERRRASAAVSRDRRRVDRRQPPRHGDAGSGGRYRLIQERDGCHILETTRRIEARCPECANDLEFELPRFAEPPTRLDVTVVHAKNGAGGAQHYVETEAFTPSGRSLLACRILARRRAGGSATTPRSGAA